MAMRVECSCQQSFYIPFSRKTGCSILPEMIKHHNSRSIWAQLRFQGGLEEEVIGNDMMSSAIVREGPSVPGEVKQCRGEMQFLVDFLQDCVMS